DGSDAKQVTLMATGADGETWSPDGKSFLFVSEVNQPCTDDGCPPADFDMNKVKAHFVNRLLYRHWTTWKDNNRSHLHLVSANGGPVRDLTPEDFDVPPFSLGDPDGYAFSPDGREVAYAS